MMAKYHKTSATTVVVGSVDNGTMTANERVRHEDLLSRLVQIEVEVDEAETLRLDCLPESLFHELTRQTERDHTGTRPYSGSFAMCRFIRRFGCHLLGGETSEGQHSNDSPYPTLVAELGGGIGLCGTYLAKHHRNCQVTITDKEDLVLDIARKNASELSNVNVQRLEWTDDPTRIHLQHKSFDLIFGTDLLYYQTDAKALMSTIDTLLSKDGIAFLPATIRCPRLPDELLAAAETHDICLTKISIEAFLNAKQLESFFGWWSLTFLVAQRKNVDYPSRIRDVLHSCRQRAYDPNETEDY